MLPVPETEKSVLDSPFHRTAPRHRLRDHDSIYGDTFRRQVSSMGIKEVLTSPRSPWQSPYVERLIGSIGRECLDHIIVINEKSLREVLRSYFSYYHDSRCHLELNKDSHRNPEKSSHPIRAGSSGFRRWADFIIATSDAQPDHTFLVTSRAIPHLKASVPSHPPALLRPIPCRVLQVGFHPIQRFSLSETICPTHINFRSDGFMSRDSASFSLAGAGPARVVLGQILADQLEHFDGVLLV
jgi:hypothetical protein